MPTTAAKRVTAADVARSLGISRATVGFVLNDTPGQKISDATRERVIAEAKRLGYRANTAARALASGRTRIVLLVMPDWPLDHNLRTNLDEASLALDEAGYSLVTMTPHSGGKAQPLWETLNPDVVMGLTPFSRAQIARFRAAGVEHIVPDTAREDGTVLDELSDGPALQVRHLVERGRARLAYAASPDVRLADLRDLRLATARAEVDRTPDAELVDVVEVDAATAADRLRELIAVGVDGVIAYNDDVAALLLRAALRAGVAVPDGLAIVGHDDTPLAALLVPSLSSVRVDIAGLGRYFAQMALTAAAGTAVPADRPRATTEIVARETT
ncbi:LacI family DNA-binding transcriptional regulator [Microbacterium kyungheense]|uniref:DNA-binding LacI/PurR family transcriptional regulator n=1 Tax=Microbacterium kyungheense TaxID=1263636 RepID=A0A543FIT3_9MICO|nr:LacI family DNA-binding transcriptional regulator [Microbacterium kyungheense]TQM33773.1 DNA-binding LacI/PurR family transcriptional regulator [Microbacterium kyungheense]